MMLIIYTLDDESSSSSIPKEFNIAMFWNRWLEKKVVKKSHLTQVVEAFGQIKPENFADVFSSDMSISKITVCRTCIQEYCELLKSVIDTIKEDRLLYATKLDLDTKNVYVRDFFTTKDQMMLDPIEASGVFINLCVKFLILYEEREKVPDKSFNLEKNLLLTQQLVGNLSLLSKEL